MQSSLLKYENCSADQTNFADHSCKQQELNLQMISLGYLFLLGSLSVHGFSFQSEPAGYTDRINRVVGTLEMGSDADKNDLFSTNDLKNSWSLILEQSILQKKNSALSAILECPRLIDWAGSDSSGFLLAPIQFATVLKQLKLEEHFIFDYGDQGKIIADFVFSQDSLISNLTRTTDVEIVNFVFGWMVSIKSIDHVRYILDNQSLFGLISEKSFENQIILCLQEDNLEIFRLLLENSNSLKRVVKDSNSIWSSVFPRVLDYNMNLAQRKKNRPSKLMSYILSSKEIMKMINPKIVSSICDASISNYEKLDLISDNAEALRKINKDQLSRALSAGLKRDVISEVVARLWLTKPELSTYLTPEILGLIFLKSAKKTWRTIFEVIIDRDDLLASVDVGLLNKGIAINTDKNLDIIGTKLISSSLLQEKVTRLSLGILFSRFLALQYDNIVNAFLERDELMSLVPPQYLAEGIDSLIVEDTGTNTESLVQLFLTDKYIARITDADWWTIVKHSIRFNKRKIWTKFFQHDSIIRRLPTTFLKKIKKYVEQDQQTAITQILKERPSENIMSNVRKYVHRFKDRRVKPQISYSLPTFSREEIQAEFNEIKDMVKEMTKDGHALTLSEKDSLIHRVLENHVPKYGEI